MVAGKVQAVGPGWGPVSPMCLWLSAVRSALKQSLLLLPVSAAGPLPPWPWLPHSFLCISPSVYSLESGLVQPLCSCLPAGPWHTKRRMGAACYPQLWEQLELISSLRISHFTHGRTLPSETAVPELCFSDGTDSSVHLHWAEGFKHRSSSEL